MNRKNIEGLAKGQGYSCRMNYAGSHLVVNSPDGSRFAAYKKVAGMDRFWPDENYDRIMGPVRRAL